MDSTTLGQAPLTVVREATPRARFTYRCNCCSLPIPAGSPHHLYVIRDADSLNPRKALRQWRVHLVCPEAIYG